MKRKSKCLKDFYIRIPFHSYDFYKDNLKSIEKLNSKKFLDKLRKEKGELICSASNDLYDSLKNGKQDEEKKFLSSLKYLIRSSTRATPYGLLSGVAKGEFSDKEYLNINDFKKKASADLEWLINVAKKMEKRVGKQLRVCFNNSLICHEDRVYNTWASCYTDEDKSKIDIKNTNAIRRVMRFCPYGVYKTIDEIYKYLMKEYQAESTSMFSNFISELINSEILISDLRISMVNNDPMNFLLKKLSFYGLTEEYCQLNSIYIKLDYYNNIKMNSNKAVNVYFELIHDMKKLYKCKNIIKHDMYLERMMKYSNKEKKNIEEFYNFLNNFDDTKYMYSNYYNLFINKYGYTCVKYLDVIDPIYGIGYPKKDILEKSSANYKKIFNLLFKNREKAIDLSVLESELKTNNLDAGNAELSFYIQKEKDSFKYVSSPLLGSNMDGKSFGRFSYLFKNEKFLSHDENNEKIEVSFLPSQERIANVLLCKSKAENILELSSYSEYKSKHISLEDIYVFPHREKLLFYDIKRNKVIDFISTNMTNMQFFPDVLSTLIYLTEAKYKNHFILFQYINEFYSHSLYRPKISYKNFIISPERWTLGKELFDNITDYKQFLSEFKKIKTENKISNDVYVGNGDNYLLLNLKDNIHQEIMYEMVKKNNIVNFIKYEIKANNHIISKNTEKYLGEFVFQMESESQNTYRMDLPKYDVKCALKNTLILFEECIYMKIFSRKSDQDYLLLTYIKPFIEILNKSHLVNNCFYIRYKDEADHIRLRLLYNKENNSALLTEILNFQNKIYSSGIVFSISFYPYEREYLRYGGEKNIRYFEKYFTAESYDILQYLNKKNNLSKEILFVSSCILTLERLSIPIDKSLKMFRYFLLNKSDKSDLQKFRKHNKELIDIIFKRKDCKSDIYEMINTQKIEYNLKERIKNNSFEEFDLDNIILSLFHMRFNRLIGINRQYENKLMAYIENILYTENKRRFYENKMQSLS